jgi:hypothetical protein
MADTIRDVVIRVSLQQVDTKLKPPNLAPLIQQVQLYEKTAVSATTQVSASFNTLNLQVNNFNNTQEQTRQKAEETAKKIAAEYNKAAAGFVTAANGALTLAKGIASLAGASQEQLKEAFAPVEAAMEIFRGGTEIIKGVSQAMTALQAASTAGAAAQGALAVGNTAVAATGSTAAASMAAFNAALGPIGLALMAVVAAVTAAVMAYEKLAASAQAVKDAEEDLAKFRNRNKQPKPEDEGKQQRDELQKRAALASLENDEASRLEAKKKLIQDFEAAAEASRAKETAFLKQTQALEKKIEAAKVEQVRRSREAQERQQGDLKMALAMGLVSPGAAAVQVGKMLLDPGAEKVADPGRLSDLEPPRERLDNLEDGLKIASELRDGAQREIEVGKQRLKVEEKNLDLAKQQLAAIDEQIKLQRRNEAVSLGELSNRDFKTLERLIAKAESGKELTRGEREELKRVGGAHAQPYLNSLSAEIGRERERESNPLERLRKLTPDEFRGDLAGEQLSRQREKAQQAQTQIERHIQELNEQQAANEKLLTEMTDVAKRLTEKIDAAQQQIRAINDSLKDS